MTKHTISRVAAILIAFVALFSNTGCKESAILNTNITPASDSLHIDGDDVAITAKTVMSPFITSQYFSGIPVTMGVGLISNDPEVGKTDASVYFQVIPSQSSGYVLPDASLIDSVVVVMPYIGFTYGDTTGTNPQDLTFTAFAMTEGMTKGDTLFNDSYKGYDGNNPLGTATMAYASFKDSMSIEGKKVMPHLRIKLDQNNIMSRLQGAQYYTSYLDFMNNNNFKGIYIKTTGASGNIIPYFRLTDDNSGTSVSKAGLVVYYHEANTTNLKYDVFGYNPEVTTHFNRVIQDITGSKAASMDTANYAFLQSRPGLSIEVSTKDIAQLSDRIINKAEIIITEVISDNQQREKYFAPRYLFPYKVTRKSVDGHELLDNIKDAVFTSSAGTQVSGLDFIGGDVKKVTINGQECYQYVLNVPKEFQQALRENKEMTVRITGVASGFPGAFRLKAGKTNPSDPFRIRMNVVYSKL